MTKGTHRARGSRIPWIFIGAFSVIALVLGVGSYLLSNTAQTAIPTVTASSSPIDDVNCDGFASQWGAQQFFDANSPESDPYNLDQNENGLACEALPNGSHEDGTTGKSVPPSTTEPKITKSGTPDTSKVNAK